MMGELFNSSMAVGLFNDSGSSATLSDSKQTLFSPSDYQRSGLSPIGAKLVQAALWTPAQG